MSGPRRPRGASLRAPGARPARAASQELAGGLGVAGSPRTLVDAPSHAAGRGLPHPYGTSPARNRSVVSVAVAMHEEHAAGCRFLCPHAAPILIVQPASAAATHHAGSCRISGDFAVCVASGNATGGIKNIYAHVSASPNQTVDVSWSMVCVKGSGAASKSGSFTATTSIRRYLKMPFFRPRSCSVATSAQLSGSGSLHVWNTYHRVNGT